MTEKKQASGKTAPKDDLRKSLIYIGPDIPGAKQFTIFNNGLPDALKEKIKEHPFFHSLVVPVDKLAQARLELSREGSALSVFYKKAAVIIKK